MYTCFIIHKAENPAIGAEHWMTAVIEVFLIWSPVLLKVKFGLYGQDIPELYKWITE